MAKIKMEFLLICSSGPSNFPVLFFIFKKLCQEMSTDSPCDLELIIKDTASIFILIFAANEFSRLPISFILLLVTIFCTGFGHRRRVIKEVV